MRKLRSPLEFILMRGRRKDAGDRRGIESTAVNSSRIMKKRSLFWDWYARFYDGLLDTIPYRAMVCKVADCVPVGTAALLDAGCGTGNLLGLIREQRPCVALHGIDFSEAMLRRAKAKVPEARFIAGDLNAALPYPDESFDAVTCINVFYSLREPGRTLAELRRILKPGGKLIISSPLAQPRIRAFIQAHATEAGWLRTVPVLVRLSVLVLFNALIFRRGYAGEYHFMDVATVQELLACEEVQPAYAGQNWLACVRKQQTAPTLPEPSKENTL